MTPADRRHTEEQRSRPAASQFIRNAATQVTIAAWLSLAALLGYWYLLAAWGDRWWPATILLYAQRWPLAVPLLAVVALSVIWARRALAAVAAAAVVFFWPIMGLCISWRATAPADKPPLRVLSLSAEGGAATISALAAMVRAYEPDVVTLQERDRQRDIVWPEGWHVLADGEFLIASRYELSDPQRYICLHSRLPWPAKDALRCVVHAPYDPVPVCSVHLYSPRLGIQELFSLRTSPARSAASGCAEKQNSGGANPRRCKGGSTASPRPRLWPSISTCPRTALSFGSAGRVTATPLL